MNIQACQLVHLVCNYATVLRDDGVGCGFDIVDSVVRLATMNLYLHGVGGLESPVKNQDSLASDSGQRYDLILANPPFGKKSSITVMSEEGLASKDALSYERTDFVATTSNKQLNFLQHTYTILTVNGTGAVVLPDNVLLEGGAGETICRKLLKDCAVWGSQQPPCPPHRLPDGVDGALRAG